MDFYSIVEKARKTGKIDKGINEVIKAIELGVAKLVVYAKDVEPKEMVLLLPTLCKDKGIICFEVDSKQRLGVAAGINVNAAAVAIIQPGEADKDISQLKTVAQSKTKSK